MAPNERPPSHPNDVRAPAVDHVRVAIVGTGFAGLGAGIMLGRHGVDYAILERADDVGGTWRDNRYPGCRCDVPSHLYSFSFAPNPNWTQTYSPQPEIWDYLRGVARDSGVIDKVRFGHDVQDAAWDVDAQRWRIRTSAGDLTTDMLILGNGPLAEPAVPDITGLDTFTGTMFHSAQWRSDHDLGGEKVAVIGTGASSIQFVPEIQPRVAHLTLFQRTPPWVLPHHNRPITGTERAIYRRFPALQRLVRATVYWSREWFVTGLLRNNKTLKAVERLARGHLARQITDPELRAKLTPQYRPGCKRLLLSNKYYPSLQKPNVDVVTEKIIEVRPHSIVTADGIEHPTDTIILGTGFHVTDNPIADRVQGADGHTLAQHWSSVGAQAYLGTTVPGFPNMFLLAGPNTGIGHTSLVVMIEAQLNYILDVCRSMERHSWSSVDVSPAAFKRWCDEIQAKAASTVWNSGGCASWYLDAEGRNTTLWPDYTFRFARRTRYFDPANYNVVPRTPGTTPPAGAASHLSHTVNSQPHKHAGRTHVAIQSSNNVKTPAGPHPSPASTTQGAS
ncbi:MAG: flavin-containing monooxygenase [Acidimicrobiales bacterium]